MGYEALFFGRIDLIDRENRENMKQMEFMWQPTFERANGEETVQQQLFTHVMYRTYCPPCELRIPTEF